MDMIIFMHTKVGLDCSNSNVANTCKTSWMHISVNDLNAPSLREWIMSRYGASGSYYLVSLVYEDGCFTSGSMNSSFFARPVFFLKSNVELIGGLGTASEPFIIL